MTYYKEKFEQLYQDMADMAEFRRTHKAAKCAYCACTIAPGWPIYVHDDMRHIYCSPECACEVTCIEKIEKLELFQMDGVSDDGYRSFFERKENDDDDDT